MEDGDGFHRPALLGSLQFQPLTGANPFPYPARRVLLCRLTSANDFSSRVGDFLHLMTVGSTSAVASENELEPNFAL